jgi:hypothetical protein
MEMDSAVDSGVRASVLSFSISGRQQTFRIKRDCCMNFVLFTTTTTTTTTCQYQLQPPPPPKKTTSEAAEGSALLGRYEVLGGSCLPTFRDILSVQS